MISTSKTYKTVDDDEFFEYIWLMMRIFETSVLDFLGFDETQVFEAFNNYAKFKIMRDRIFNEE